MSDTNEVGCQIILTTGEHIGECKGTCTEPDVHGRLDAAVGDATGGYGMVELGDLAARIDALEGQVRELQGHRHTAQLVFGVEGTAGATQARPKDNAGNAPPLKQVTKADFQNPEARAALASAAEAQGIQAQAILDELDNAGNAPKQPPLDNMGETQTR